ncbi:MAG TPA: type II toxin-antitoxin system RelE/ParE family toxin [Spirochaetota bacterium]|nr:type II toxin-antitoxin system RelE/ParE family toxin [Spirochaetota bacterium]
MQARKRTVLHYVVDGRDIFEQWLRALPDLVGQAATVKRLGRMEEGNFGDCRGLGSGLWELRVHSGPGYRVYFGEDGPVIIVILCGGDKRSQTRDIRKARKFWDEYRRLK